MPRRGGLQAVDPARLSSFGRVIYDYLLSFRPTKSVNTFAAECNVSGQAVWDWIHGNTVPRRATINMIAQHTTLNEDELLRAAGLPDSHTDAAERKRLMREFRRIVRDTEAELIREGTLTEDERRLFILTLRNLGPRVVERAAASGAAGDETDDPILTLPIEPVAPPTPSDDDEEVGARRRAPAHSRR